MPFSHLLLGVSSVAPLVVVYLFLLRGADRFHADPLWSIGVAFTWGAVVATVAAFIGIQLAEHEVSLWSGLRADSRVLIAESDVLVAPFLEEAFKAFGLVLLLIAARPGRYHFDGALDGLVFGAAVGLGFTLTEDALEVSRAFAEHGPSAALSTTFLRTVIGGFGHCTFTALTGVGLGLGAAATTRPVRFVAPPVFFAGAVALHVIHNVLAGADPNLLFAKIVSFWAVDGAFAVVFAVLVRRERGVIVRELSALPRTLVGAGEIAAVSSYFLLDVRLLRLLLTGRFSDYQARAEKQRALVTLALLEKRRRRSPDGQVNALARRLRRTIARCNEMGVRLEA